MKINKLEGAVIEIELANEDERQKVLDYLKAKGYKIGSRQEYCPLPHILPCPNWLPEGCKIDYM